MPVPNLEDICVELTVTPQNLSLTGTRVRLGY
jgi:hypothetical protein